MKPHVVVLQHVAMEGPAGVLDAATRAGLGVTTVLLHEGRSVPAVHDDDILVVMGGPMGVADVGQRTFPFLADEVALLKKRVARRAPTLGICLGAQLIAHAAGARVYANTHVQPDGTVKPVIELGWAPVDFVAAPEDPLLQGLRRQEMMLHWHGDTFDLPQGAVHVAATPTCRHQAFHLDHKLFALQFHCEVDAASVSRWVREDAAYVEKARGPQGAAAVLEETRALSADVWRAGERLLGNVFACLLA